MTNKDFFLNSWQRDHAATAKAFRSLPNEKEKLNQQHHPKFRSPWELVNHIGPHAREISQALREGRVDLVNEGKFDLNGPNIYKSLDTAAKDVEETSAKLGDIINNYSENDWTTKQIPVYWGPMKIMDSTPMQFCWMMLFDTIHHRGQLTSYYRPIGSVQPSIMGPTWEDEEAMMSKSN